MGNYERKELVLPGKTPALFCDAVQYGDLIFTSGLVARNPDSSVHAPGDVVAQTRYIFDNLKNILALGGSSFQNIIRIVFYVRNMEDRLKINPLREEYFKGVRPASTVIEVSKLAHPDLLVEVEVVAIAGEVH
jgi:2-iminobutanoate/2-iminopropanoate deaminase